MSHFILLLVNNHLIVNLLTRVMIAKFDDNSPDSWIVRCGYVDEPNYAIYIAALYFILTTILTVGFGDISGVTINERY